MNGHLLYVVGAVLVGVMLWNTVMPLVHDFQAILETFRAATGGG